MRRLLTCALLSSLLTGLAWGAEPPAVVPSPQNEAASYQSPPMTLPEAINLARLGNFAIAASKVGLAREEWAPYIARGIFDRTLRLGLTHNSRQTNGSDGVTSGSDSDSTSLSTVVTVPTQTGGQWSLEYNAQRVDVRSATGGGNDGYSSDVEVNFRHPLLEGAGKRRTSSGITQAEIGVDITRANLDREFLSLEQTVTQQFLAVLRAQRQLETARISLDVANALFDQIAAQVEAGSLAQFEQTNAEGGLATREEAVLLAQQGVDDALDELKQTLGIPRDVPLVLDPNPAYDSPPDVTFEQYLGIANDNRPELRVFDLREQQNEVSLFDAKDNLKDTLDFTAGVGLNGEGRDFGKSLEDMEDINWVLGVEYLIPLGRDRRAKGQYEQARLALDQLALERAETETQIESDLSQAIRDVEVAEQRLSITATGVRVAQERLDNERARLDLGLTTATFVLEVEEDLAQARRSQIEADLNVVAARARLLNVLGLSQLAGNPPIDGVEPESSEQETAPS